MKVFYSRFFLIILIISLSIPCMAGCSVPKKELTHTPSYPLNLEAVGGNKADVEASGTLADNSVLKEAHPIDAFSIELTEEFTKQYKKSDYKSVFNQSTDKIIINYIGFAPALPEEEQYSINYYSTRNIEGAEAGYIAACLEETAWKLWGHFKTGIGPIIFSGYHYYNGHTDFNCMYGFGYVNNLAPDEFGNTYPYEKFKAQTLSSISISAGYSLWVELGNETSVKLWEEKEKEICFNSYYATRLHINPYTADNAPTFTPASSPTSANFEGSYYNYFFRFDIFKNYDNPNTYSLVFAEERYFEVDGILETGQYEILSRNHTTSYNNGNQIITFQIQDDPDYSGTISVQFDSSKPKGEQYYVCINIPAIAFDGTTYTLINHTSY